MSKSTVAVIDYGMGNLHSAAKALEHVAPGVEVRVTHEADKILSADRVVFPGVGAIRDCMGEILRLGMDEVVREAARSKPLLGICVGMQSMMTHSQENGGVDCLNLFRGEVNFFGDTLTDASGAKLKVPHMGWNQVRHERDHPLWKDIPDNSRFYFVHSYYVTLEDPSLVTGSGEYGVPFVATLGQDNVFAAQFHPEKSQKAGLTLLKNFMEWDGQS